MKIEIDIEGLSGGTQHDLIKVITNFLEKESLNIKQNLKGWNDKNGIAYKQMEGWAKAASEQAFQLRSTLKLGVDGRYYKKEI